MSTHSIKNVTDGIRYVNTTGGPIGLAPGEVGEKLDLSAGELKAARGTGWFEIDGKAATDVEQGHSDHPGIGEGSANDDTTDMEPEPPATGKKR